MVDNTVDIHGSLTWVTAIHNSMTAINAPTKSDQSPTSKSIAGACL